MNTYKMTLLAVLGLNLPIFGMSELTRQSVARQATRMAKTTQEYVQKHVKKIAGAVGALGVYKAQDDIRLATLNYGQKLQEKYPQAFQALVTDPLVKSIHYHSMDQYLKESARATLKRQKIARTLAQKGVPLNLSPTEADILTHQIEMDSFFPDTKKYNSKAFYNQILGHNHDGPYFSHCCYNGGKVPQDTTMFNSLFDAEKRANSKGNVVLYHAMPKSFYALNYIGTLLHKASSGQTYNDDFLLLRQPITTMSKYIFPKVNNGALKETFQQLKNAFWNYYSYGHITDDNMREKLLAQPGYDNRDTHPKLLGYAGDYDPNMSKYLISANPAITSNSHRTEESSLHFLTQDEGVGGCIASSDVNNFKLLFEKNNIPSELHEKYEKKLAKVCSEFGQNQHSGVMLQMTMPPQLLDATSYISHSGGIKRNVYHTDSGKLITKPSELLVEFKANPFNIHFHDTYTKEKADLEATFHALFTGTEWGGSGVDRTQLRVIADKSVLLNPNNKDVTNNFSVKAYMPNQSHLTKFQTEIDQIMKDLAEDLKK